MREYVIFMENIPVEHVIYYCRMALRSVCSVRRSLRKWGKCWTTDKLW